MPRSQTDDGEAWRGRLDALLRTIPDALITIDEQGLIETFSPAAERMFGYAADEVRGQNVRMLMPHPFQEQHDSYLRRYRETGERRIIGIGRIVAGQRKDGTTFPLELSVGEFEEGGRRRFLGAARDISRRETNDRRAHDLQDRHLDAARASAMAGLYSALAHELNQPLSAVGTYIEAGRSMLPRIDALGEAAVSDIFAKAAEQSLRASDIVRRLRQLFEQGEVERRAEDANGVVQEAYALALIGAPMEGVRGGLDLSPDLPAVLIDGIQVQQVIINLVRNALEAMTDGAEKELWVCTAPHDDDFVLVSVIDSGTGIDEAVAARLFQPFVTTKKSGMGIGLRICHNIVDRHGGRIWADPRTGGGTAFRFTVPVAAA